MRVTYSYIRPTTVVYARSTGPYAASSRDAWQRITHWLDRHQARKRVKQALGFFRDNPKTTAPELLRYDACLPAVFGIEAEPDAGISLQTLPGGAFAMHTHIGSYDELGDLFSRLHHEVVPKRGLCVDYERPFMAIYQNDPLVTREVHRRTELCVPVLPVYLPAVSNDDFSEVEAARRIGRSGQMLDWDGKARDEILAS